ncbi:GGDEF domain-containing protein [Campylobacter sp. 9BO]|uniref:GGDEF domain-containing protein n=1 Tax=Campylobacter sp. 9BO TaxID=3424759 RepID=UPI003D33757B
MTKFQMEITDEKIKSLTNLYGFILGVLFVFHAVSLLLFVVAKTYACAGVVMALFAGTAYVKNNVKNQDLISLWMHISITSVSVMATFMLGFYSGFYMLVMALIFISCTIGNKLISYILILIEIAIVLVLYFFFQEGILLRDNWLIKLSHGICYATAFFMVFRVILFVNSLIQDRFKKIQDEKDEIVKSSMYDHLTGLLNRRSIEEIFEKKLKHTKNTNSVVLLGDIDNFKMINDIYGHIWGDKILKNVADTLKGTFRKDDIVCRWGGEEFLIILPEVKVDFIGALSERLLKNINSIMLPSGVPATMTFGMAIYLRGITDEFNIVIQRVDALLYNGKKAGKDRVEMEIVK